MAISAWTPLTLKYLCMYNVQKVLPAVYDDSLSYYELLAKMMDKCNEMVGDLNQLNEWQAAQDEVLNELEKLVRDFIDGGYLESFETFVNRWLDANLAGIITRATKMLWFGLTQDGHFCAYVPDSWSDITFDTGAVYGRSDYGRLILKAKVDGPNAIDNTYSYTLNAQPSDFDAMVRDLEVTTRRGDASYYALFTNLDAEVPNGNF